MSEAGWQELRLQTRSPSVEALEEWLFAAGAVAVTLEDAADQPLLEPGPGETPLWDDITLVALFTQDVELAPVAATVPSQWLVGAERAMAEVPDQDWERAWMDNFHPMRMGERLWVCPSWHEPPHADAVNLILDPGLAFGTGTHPTTALCLGALDADVCTGDRVVDYGCGSGILAIAALKLGAATALGIDNDPQAVVASRDNGARNAIDEARLAVVMPNAIPGAAWHQSADVVVANILANPLIELAADIVGFLKPGATLLLAGLLHDQADAVCEAYAPWLALTVRDTREGWALLSGVNPEPATP